MKQWFVSIILISIALVSAIAADNTERGLSFAFATINKGQNILTHRDDFVRRLSPFDRSARMKTNIDVSEEIYLRFVGESVQSWSSEEKAHVDSALSSVKARISELALQWPETIYLIRTSGSEEGNAAYTRDNAIVLPTKVLVKGNVESLKKILAHELFHILTRKNPSLKQKLYAAIGFHYCGELKFPSRLQAIKITNPDAPKNDHCIRLQVAGKSAWAVPILFSRSSTYDMNKGGEFFNYLQFKFLLVDGDSATAPLTARYDDSKVELIDPEHVSGFYEQVGRNTNYLIHPEEILADNFALQVLGEQHVASPEIIRKIMELVSGMQAVKSAVPSDRSTPISNKPE